MPIELCCDNFVYTNFKFNKVRLFVISSEKNVREPVECYVLSEQNGS